jgi:hypothetical protein
MGMDDCSLFLFRYGTRRKRMAGNQITGVPGFSLRAFDFNSAIMAGIDAE